MNADWAKGRNERTGLEGIFPRSYVNILDEKPPQQSYGYNGGSYGARPPTTTGGTSYGNMPMEVSQSGGGGGAQGGGKESKLGANGKKFGKKLGNASEYISYPCLILSTITVIITLTIIPSLNMAICTLTEIFFLIIAIFGAGATIGSNIVNGIL